jgi:hypothetical protein
MFSNLGHAYHTALHLLRPVGSMHMHVYAQQLHDPDVGIAANLSYDRAAGRYATRPQMIQLASSPHLESCSRYYCVSDDPLLVLCARTGKSSRSPMM